jgi:ABC-type antimicrobial peptide transport system permease subunit
MPLLADRIHEVDGEIQVGSPRDYSTLLRGRLIQPRFNMLLVIVFSAVALVLAGVGIYGVVSRAVAARTREIGIRLALGAQQTRVVREVVTRSVSLATGGVLAGLALALILSRFIRSLLHGVAYTDPPTYTVVALLILSVAVLASLVPAFRASRVDPMESLREE